MQGQAGMGADGGHASVRRRVPRHWHRASPNRKPMLVLPALAAAQDRCVLHREPRHGARRPAGCGAMIRKVCTVDARQLPNQPRPRLWEPHAASFEWPTYGSGAGHVAHGVARSVRCWRDGATGRRRDLRRVRVWIAYVPYPFVSYSTTLYRTLSRRHWQPRKRRRVSSPDGRLPGKVRRPRPKLRRRQLRSSAS